MCFLEEYAKAVFVDCSGNDQPSETYPDSDAIPVRNGMHLAYATNNIL